MFVMSVPKSIAVIPVYANASSPIVSRESGKTNLPVKEVQYLNAASPMLTMPSPSST